MRRFFIPAAQIAHQQAILHGPEFHHLRHVLRLAVGDTILLADDLKREHSGVITHLTAAMATVAITESTAGPTSVLSLTLVQGLLKGQKMDLLIEKATELGVQRILPFTSTFTVAQVPQERKDQRVTRWTRIAQSAAKQSGSHVPQIDPPVPFSDLLPTLPLASEHLLFYEKEQYATLKTFAQTHPGLASVCIIVGAEGGFAPTEVESASNAGVHVLSLGSTTLRAETAALVAVALCRFLWGE